MQIVAAPSKGSGGAIGINGPERRAANLVRRWRARGIVPIICYPSRGQLWNAFAEAGEEVIDFEVGSKFAFHRALAIARLVRKHGADIVHTQGPASLDLVAWLARCLHRRPLVVTRPVMIEEMRTRSAVRLRLYQTVDRLTLARSDRLIVVSHRGAQQLSEIDPTTARRLAVIHNGVDLSRFTAVARARTQRDRPCVIGMVAQLTPQKAWPDFIRVIARLRGSGRDVRGLVVGEGHLRAALETIAADEGVAHLIEFAGFHQDVAPLLARMHLFLFTSRWEGLSVAVIEAMASGLPVVATEVGAIREQVEDGRNGFVLSPGDVNGLAAACEKLILDANQRRAMGEMSTQIALARFSEDAMLSAHCDLYNDVVRRGQ